jgi:hypothetical protein
MANGTEFDFEKRWAKRNAHGQMWDAKRNQPLIASVIKQEFFEAAKKGASDFIRAVVDETWYKALRHPVTFYNNVTAFTLLEYLHTNSGGLHSNDLATLPSEMLHYYADAEGIPEFILALAKAREKLARGGLPMSDATVLATAHSQVFASMHYPEATREWERLPSAQQTWVAWKAKYREANIERLRLQRANPNSFGNAHYVAEAPLDHDAISSALDNIANAATNDSTVMASILAKLSALETRLDNLQPAAPSPRTPTSSTPKKAKASKKPKTYTCKEALGRVTGAHMATECIKRTPVQRAIRRVRIITMPQREPTRWEEVIKTKAGRRIDRVGRRHFPIWNLTATVLIN